MTSIVYKMYTFYGTMMKPNKKQACQTDLVNRILSLDIAPGSILDEIAIAELYDLSRTPLREVFQKMAGEGYIVLEENRGAKVSSMDFENMRQFFQSAPMIYSAIAKLAVENASRPQIEALKNAQSAFRRNGEAGEAQEMAIQNHRFHSIMGEMAGNPYLSPSLNRLLIDHTRMGQKFYRPSNSAERERVWLACDQHDRMIEAIENRDPGQIVQLTLDHWELSRNQIEKFVTPDPLPMKLSEQENDAATERKSHAV